MNDLEEHLEEILKQEIKKYISQKLDLEIEEKMNKFYKELTYRKDDYIAEIMKSIRILHEKDQYTLGTNYKIIFENKVELIKGE